MRTKQSLIFTNPTLYRLVMKILYGRHYEDRYQALADEIPEKSSLVDLCCGDCYIYTHYLKQKQVNYLGLDISPQFIRSAQDQEINVRHFDVWKEAIPRADIVMMQASLHYFIPHGDSILRRMLDSASQKVLVAEPVQNLSSSRNPLIAYMGRLATKPESKVEDYSGQRYNRQTLMELFTSEESFDHAFPIPGEREVIGIFYIK